MRAGTETNVKISSNSYEVDYSDSAMPAGCIYNAQVTQMYNSNDGNPTPYLVLKVSNISSTGFEVIPYMWDGAAYANYTEAFSFNWVVYAYKNPSNN